MIDSSSLPWVEKYRPHSVDEVLGHEHAISTIRALLKGGNLPHILLHGPPGTGKTSLVQAICRLLYGPHVKSMVLELNASDDRGIGAVRHQIKTFAESSIPIFIANFSPMAGSSQSTEAALPAGTKKELTTIRPEEDDEKKRTSGEIPTKKRVSAAKTTSGQAAPSKESGKTGASPPGRKRSIPGSKTQTQDENVLTGNGTKQSSQQQTLLSFFGTQQKSTTVSASSSAVEAPASIAVTSGDSPTNTVMAAVRGAVHPKVAKSTAQRGPSLTEHAVNMLPSGDEVAPNLRKLKLVVLDEVDQMTAAAQTALRRIMEKHASRVRFFLMCNDISKINPPIQSRCTKFRFAPLPMTAIRQKLEIVKAKEGIIVDENVQELLIRVANGDFRRLLNTLEAAALSFPDTKQVHEDAVYKVLGLPTANEIAVVFDTLATKPLLDSYQALLALIKSQGYATIDVLNALYERVLNVDWPNSAAITLLPRLADVEPAHFASGKLCARVRTRGSKLLP